ncbi:hypothetical protein MJO29_013057 [Puccinia striiformis f. sp. tritici]|nr:hypothetical protein MJO29_013057 [Puccinia striiformis f. sp. tritici]
MEHDTLGNKAPVAAKHTEDGVPCPAYDRRYEVLQINNWEIVSEKYEDIEKMYVSVKCLFLLANLIKKYQSIQPSFMGKVNTFKPDTIFKMAILKSEFKAKIQRGFQWGHYNLESDSSGETFTTIHKK